MKENQFVQRLVWYLALILPQSSTDIHSPKRLFVKSHPFRKGKNVVSKLLQTKASDAEIKKQNKKTTLRRPCGGTREEQLHSRLRWRAMRNSLQGTWNLKKKEKTFYPFLLLTHYCECWEARVILTSGSLVDNWAAVPDSSRPGECTPAWLQFALKNENHQDGCLMLGHLLIKSTLISLSCNFSIAEAHCDTYIE